MVLFALVIACLFWCAVIVSAATYYVDFGAGADGNNGTSTATAFRHCPGDTNATATAASTVLAPSDVVQFKGGVSYVLGKIVPASGVTYDGNSAGSWGTGKAILTDNNANPGHAAFWASVSLSNTTFRSLVITNLGGSATLPADPGHSIASNPGFGIVLASGCTNVLATNCDFAQIGYWFNQKPMDVNSISGVGVSVTACNGLTLGGCRFRRVNIAVENAANPYTSNLVVTACEFTDSVTWGVDLAMGAPAASMDNVEVSGCLFHDTQEFTQGQWTGYGEWPHVDGIFLRCDFANCVYGPSIKVFGNKFWNQGNGTASIYITEGPSCDVFNNQFVGTGMSRTILLNDGPQPGGSAQTVNIYNNSIWEWYNLPLEITDQGTGRPVQTVRFKNSIIKTSSLNENSLIISLAEDYRLPTNTLSTRFDCDYNAYESANTNNAFWGTFPQPGLTIARAHGLDAHSTTNAVLWANTAYAINGPTPQLNDLHLTSGSSARATGVNLSAVFTTDFAGATRTVPWDMGAYLFGGNPPGPQLFLGGNVILRGNVIIR